MTTHLLIPTAIETMFKGYRFRSRLEARWAVFFDALDLQWEYEAQGFEADGVCYVPDFALEGKWLVEVKPLEWKKSFHAAVTQGATAETLPDAVNRDLAKWDMMGRKQTLLVVFGLPDMGQMSWLFDPRLVEGSRQLQPAWFLSCPKCKALGFHPSYMDDIADTLCKCKPQIFPCEPSWIEKASVAARSARFEYGARGATA